MEVWFDSEIFKWLGLPIKKSCLLDFEIEYLRVWQKPSDNLLARSFTDLKDLSCMKKTLAIDIITGKPRAR